MISRMFLIAGLKTNIPQVVYNPSLIAGSCACKFGLSLQLDYKTTKYADELEEQTLKWSIRHT